MVILFLICGVFVVRPIAWGIYTLHHFLYKIWYKKDPDVELYSDEISSELKWCIYFCSLLFIPFLVNLSVDYGGEFIISSIFSGFLWYLFQNTRYRNELKLFPSDEQLALPYIFILLMILSPLIFSLRSSLLMLPKSTVRFLHLSFEQVTVHIKTPYNKLIATNGISGKKSQLGEEYLCYEKSNILLDGLFGNTILELNDSNKNLKISIPNENIVYFQYHNSDDKCFINEKEIAPIKISPPSNVKKPQNLYLKKSKHKHCLK